MEAHTDEPVRQATETNEAGLWAGSRIHYHSRKKVKKRFTLNPASMNWRRRRRVSTSCSPSPSFLWPSPPAPPLKDGWKYCIWTMLWRRTTIKSQANAFTSAYEIALRCHVGSCKCCPKNPSVADQKERARVHTHIHSVWAQLAVPIGLEGYSRL